MPEFDIHINTADPPSPTQTVDGIAIAALPFIECFFVTCIVYTYVQAKRNGSVSYRPAHATALMCAGAAVHVLSTFVSNGHLNAVAWFRAVQNAHCPLWDFWGKFVFGFSVWFYGLLLHQLRWIHALRNVGGNARVVWENDNMTGYAKPHEQRVGPKGEYHFTMAQQQHTGDLARIAMRHRYATFLVTFGVIVLIAGAVELFHATEYNEAHRTCYTKPVMKLVMVTWIFGSMGVLIWLLVVLRRRTRQIAVARICSGLHESQRLLIVCTASLLLLLLINMTGMLIYSVPRTVYTLMLAAMYMYSVVTMYHISFKAATDSDDEVERAVHNINFSTVWGLPTLRNVLLNYVENASGERDLQLAAGCNKMLIGISQENWSTMKQTFFAKILHPDDVLAQHSTTQEAIEIARETNDQGVFCIDDDDDDFLDDDGARARRSDDADTSIPLDEAELDGAQQYNSTHVCRAELARFVRHVERVFGLLHTSPQPSPAYMLSKACEVIALYFPADLRHEQCSLAGAQTPRAVIDTDADDAGSSEDTIAISTEDDAECEASAEAMPPPEDAQAGPAIPPQTTAVPATDKQLFDQVERVFTKTQLQRASAKSNKIDTDAFLQMMPTRMRVQHVLPVHMPVLHRVYAIVISGDVACLVEVLRFLRFMHNVTAALIERHYFRRALSNSQLIKRYEVLLRQDVLNNVYSLDV